MSDRSKEQLPLQSMPALEATKSITMSNEMFEKLYLDPPNKVSGDLRRTFANPTPLYECPQTLLPLPRQNPASG